MSYQVIFAALKPDVTDAVIDAAKECGISGATIVSGRGTGLQEAKTFLGLSLETQTDVLFFLTEAELVDPVIAAIEKAGRLDEHGTGVVFTLPVDRVAGIWKEYVRRRVVRELPHSLPDLEDGVAIYGYGHEVDCLLRDLENRGVPSVVIEEDEAVAHRLYTRGHNVVQATVTDEVPDLTPMLKARALVLNGEDADNAVLALSAREQGFTGPVVAMISNPNRRPTAQLAGATVAFSPNHILGALLAARASARIHPRVAGVQPLDPLLEVAELRVHDASPLAHSSLAEARLRTETGASVVGRWSDDELQSPPAEDEKLTPGMILVAVGTPDSIRRLSEMARPIPREGPLVVLGFGDVGRKLAQLFTDAGEEVCVVFSDQIPGVDIVGDVLDESVLERAPVAAARAVILALESDNATLLVAKVVRKYAPDVPIIAAARALENVERIQAAGADFALSVSQVAGQLLSHHVLGEAVSLQPRIKLAKVPPGGLAGRHPLAAEIRERTGCSVVAVERQGEILIDFPSDFELSGDDALYLCGTGNAFSRYREAFAE